MLYKIGRFAKEIGVTPLTLRNWHKKGKLIPHKVDTNGNRYYSPKQLIDYMGDSDG
jgi:DNA-binding transcriptional MerR regulator